MSCFRAARSLPLLTALLACRVAAAQDAGTLSPRNANYTIQVRLNPAQKILEGKEVILWRNDTPVAANELRFHLYWNAWKNNKSTWIREDTLRPSFPGRNRKSPREGDWSFCEVQKIEVEQSDPPIATDMTARMHYIAPDDGNADDQTVLSVPLPRLVGPKESIRVHVQWRSKIPRTFSRTGFRGDYFFIVQWFPKLGVFQADGTWNCHQFHAATEFFSDYGVYDVEMTVPAKWLLGATGVSLGVTQNADRTATHRYQQADVHDFAWTTSPDYREARRRFEHPGLKSVDMRLLYQPEHEGQIDRHFRATESALRYYGTWYGEYPYGHVTIIDPAYGSGAGGMEYPTLFTCGTRFLNPEGGGSPEGVTVHEAGHQFWYGLIGNNEFEHAWLDEGLNTFSTTRVMAESFGANAFVRRFFQGFFPIMVREIREPRLTAGNRLDGYRPVARFDAQSTPTYLYHPENASPITYNKTALWLSTLERTLGWETLQKILSTFFDRWKFKHPKPEDFFAVANEVSGADLTSFFDEVHRKPAVFDYSIDSVSSVEVKPEGLFDRNGSPTYTPGQKASSMFETRVVVRRLQDGILPVDILLRFTNGEEMRDIWDGKYVWNLYTAVKPAKLEYAAVDPERKVLLDIHYANNTRLLESRASFPATKWASKWMIWLQDYIQTLAFLM